MRGAQVAQVVEDAADVIEADNVFSLECILLAVVEVEDVADVIEAASLRCSRTRTNPGATPPPPPPPNPPPPPKKPPNTPLLPLPLPPCTLVLVTEIRGGVDTKVCKYVYTHKHTHICEYESRPTYILCVLHPY
jgi:hypothetical protein